MTSLPAHQPSQNAAPEYRRRVLVAVPPAGFGAQLAIMTAWLDATCGTEGWAAAPAGAGGVVNDAVTFYFVRANHARAFINRFGCGYHAIPRPPTRSALS